MRDMLIPGKKLTQMRTILVLASRMAILHIFYLVMKFFWCFSKDIGHLKLTKSTFDSQVTNFQNLLYSHICEEKN